MTKSQTRNHPELTFPLMPDAASFHVKAAVHIAPYRAAWLRETAAAGGYAHRRPPTTRRGSSSQRAEGVS